MKKIYIHLSSLSVLLMVFAVNANAMHTVFFKSFSKRPLLSRPMTKMGISESKFSFSKIIAATTLVAGVAGGAYWAIHQNEDIDAQKKTS